MSHPCDRFSCPECNQGQCFGGGCRSNPAPATEREDECDNENDNETEEDN